MRITSGLLAVAVLLGATACLEEITGPPAAEVLPIGRFWAYPQWSSGIANQRRLVVTSEEEWKALWEEIHSRVMPQPPLPSVNFAEEVVVAASLGTRPSGGYGIAIESVYLDASGNAHAVVQSVEPGSSCAVPAVITNPVDAVRVPRRSSGVTFWEKSSIRNC